MGDVAISAPLVRAYASANFDSNFYMVSQPRFEAMFNFNPKTGKSKIAPKPNNLFYIPLNTKHGANDFGSLHTFDDWLDPIKDTLQIFMMS